MVEQDLWYVCVCAVIPLSAAVASVHHGSPPQTPPSLLFAHRWGPSTTFVQSDLVTSLMDHLVACLMVSVVVAAVVGHVHETTRNEVTLGCAISCTNRERPTHASKFQIILTFSHVQKPKLSLSINTCIHQLGLPGQEAAGLAKQQCHDIITIIITTMGDEAVQVATVTKAVDMTISSSQRQVVVVVPVVTVAAVVAWVLAAAQEA